jgi:hypothetical protein
MSSSENTEGSKKYHSHLLGDEDAEGIHIAHTHTRASQASNRCNADNNFSTQKEEEDTRIKRGDSCRRRTMINHD